MLEAHPELSLHLPEGTAPFPATLKQYHDNESILLLNVFDGARLIVGDETIRSVTLDVELRLGENEKPQCLTCAQVHAQLYPVREGIWEAKCYLKESSLFLSERRGGVRIPFILGMSAQVVLEMPGDYRITRAVPGNLSQGGCQLEMPIEDALTLVRGQTVRSLSLISPNGDAFSASAVVRHLRPYGRARFVCAGFEFTDLSSSDFTRLLHFVNECESEAARRLGLIHFDDGPTRLFVPKKKIMPEDNSQQQRDRHLQPAMVLPLMEVARNLKLLAFYVRNDKPYPPALLDECADVILHLRQEDRKQCLYALGYLNGEAPCHP